ncbi:MAG TPA: cell division topological specificity factor MinE [Ruminiclostridium sp.]
MLIDFAKIFGKSKPSKDVAKERLQFVLIHDRANVSPEFLEMIKGEIIKVIQHYMEIDEGALEIKLTRTKSEDGNRVVPALIANIPIRNVRNTGK